MERVKGRLKLEFSSWRDDSKMPAVTAVLQEAGVVHLFDQLLAGALTTADMGIMLLKQAARDAWDEKTEKEVQRAKEVRASARVVCKCTWNTICP